MSAEQIAQLSDLVEGIIYGRMVDHGATKQVANHVSTRAAMRVRDMVKDAL